MNLNLETETIHEITFKEKKKKRKRRNPNIKTMKIYFNLDDTNDKELFSKIENLILEVNNYSSIFPQLSSSDLLKSSLKNIDLEFAKKTRNSFLSDEIKLKIWCDSYNKTNGLNLSLFEFAVKVLPGLKQKDLNGLNSSLDV